MTRRWLVILALLCCTGHTTSTDPADAPIHLPVVGPPKPPPSPPPAPVAAVQILNQSERYVVEHTSEVFIRQSPLGVLSVKTLKGPITISGTFYGGNGAEEERTFAGPFVYMLRAADGGRADVFFIPKGVASEKQILTRAIQANTAPRPPPPPPPPPPDGKVTVPSVLNKPYPAAIATITAANLTAGTLGVQPSERPIDVVIQQTPEAGTKVSPQTAVALVVSSGAVVPPDDPETAKLTTLLKPVFAKETASDKVARVRQLSALYANASMSQTGIVFEHSLATWDDLLLAMQNGRKAIMPDTTLPATRRALADFINAKFPTASGVPLDDAGRKLAAIEFARAAEVLGGLN